MKYLYDEDEDGKDFDILVEEDGEDIPIRVHKFVLAARSKLFNGMFTSVEEGDYVKDFSGRSVEAMEAFIRFLYLEKVVFTADEDPKEIAKELEEAQEFYQLSKMSSFKDDLLSFLN